MRWLLGFVCSLFVAFGNESMVRAQHQETEIRDLQLVQIRIDSLPSDTPWADTVCVTGSFAGWDPTALRMTRTATDGRLATLELPKTLIHFKFTRGTWSSFECTAGGAAAPDRSVWVYSDTVINCQIKGWTDLHGRPKQAAVQGDLHLLGDSVYMPQLGRWRKIWVWLPPDYGQGTERYRVVYMHDAQNLFNDVVAYDCEWGVDECFTDLHLTHRLSCIVVGIENGGHKRIDELTAYQWNGMGGENDAYTRFLTENLKPQIDSLYRTKQEAEHTALVGSSLGGLASFYAVMRFTQVFGKAGVFSPSFWFAREYFDLVHSFNQKTWPKTYLLAGGMESESMVPLATEMQHTLLKAGMPPHRLSLQVRPDGQHKEWFWRRELSEAIRWLFAAENN